LIPPLRPGRLCTFVADQPRRDRQTNRKRYHSRPAASTHSPATTSPNWARRAGKWAPTSRSR